jgi:hypothetical protein
MSKTKGAEIEMKNQEIRALEYRKQIMQDKNWPEFAKEVFNMQNKARVNPKFFIGHLERCLGRFRGKTLYSEDGRSFIETKEGKTGYIEAIEFLRKQKPMKGFAWSEKLMKAAKDHVDDIGPKGTVSSIGTDGSLPTDRIS